MMRVALLSVSAGLGGSETSLLELVRGLAARPGFQPIVVVPREGPLRDRVAACGGTSRLLGMPDALLAFGEWSIRGAADLGRRSTSMARAAAAARSYRRDMAKLLGELRPDVVHTNGFKMHVIAARAAAPGVPIVWHLHEYLKRRRLSRLLLRHHVSRASAIVANSHSVAADLRESLGDTAPISTIYNAVNLEEFSPNGDAADLDALSALPPPPGGVCRVGLLATFARWKGHDVFLRAIASMTAPVRAYVIGGPMYDTAGSQVTLAELRDRASALGISDRVGFTGFIEHPAAALRALDVVVHASTEPEPFGLVIAEGMACGRTVVVSRAGGAVELVNEGTDALATTPGDAAELARTLDRVAADRDLRANLGAAARRTAERRFHPAVLAGSFADLYSRIVREATAVA